MAAQQTPLHLLVLVTDPVCSKQGTAFIAQGEKQRKTAPNGPTPEGLEHEQAGNLGKRYGASRLLCLYLHMSFPYLNAALRGQLLSL